jgi:hypothetical protein
MMCRTIGAVAVVQVVRKASRISTGQSRKVNCNDKDSLDSWHDLSNDFVQALAADWKEPR